MIVPLALLSLARADACDPRMAVAALGETGRREDYLCLVEADDALGLLLAELTTEPDSGRERLTRALALWLLARTDRAMDPDVVAELSASDRRLLADGIRARRGRASPAPEHAAVFRQFAWYQPEPGYTDARLRPIDRANLAVVDPAVRPASPPEADPTEAAVAAPPEAEPSGVCGCGTSSPPGAAAGVVALALALRRARRARKR